MRAYFELLVILMMVIASASLLEVITNKEDSRGAVLTKKEWKDIPHVDHSKITKRPPIIHYWNAPPKSKKPQR